MDLDLVHQRLDRLQRDYCSLCHRCLFEYGGVWDRVHLSSTRQGDANLDS